MEPILNEGGQDLSSLFSFSSWRKRPDDPKIRKVELALLFGIGVLLGIAAKDIGRHFLTIGYGDYVVQTPAQKIDFNRIGQELLTTSTNEPEATDASRGGTCSE